MSDFEVMLCYRKITEQHRQARALAQLPRQLSAECSRSFGRSRKCDLCFVWGHRDGVSEVGIVENCHGLLRDFNLTYTNQAASTATIRRRSTSTVWRTSAMPCWKPGDLAISSICISS